MRCRQRIFWWDTDHSAQCVLTQGHGHWHFDATRWFDDFGLQRPIDPPAAPRTESGRRAGGAAA